MKKTFAIADLHGRYDLLCKAIDYLDISFPNGGKVVFTGDYVDRGPQSAQIIEMLKNGPQDDRWQWVCLQGNHESMMLECLDNVRLIGGWWAPNGGAQTLFSYGAKAGDAVVSAAAMVPQEHIDWIKGLPLYHEDDHRVFVHAFADEALDLSDTPAHTLQWECYDREYPHGYRGKHVVHGHVQYADGPIIHDGRTDLDTFAWYTGRLVIGVFDDTQGAPIRIIEIKGDPASGMHGRD